MSEFPINDQPLKDLDEFLAIIEQRYADIIEELETLQNRIAKIKKANKNSENNEKYEKELDSISEEYDRISTKTEKLLTEQEKVYPKIKEHTERVINSLKEISHKKEKYYKQKTRIINNALALCFGALILFNISFPKFDTNILATFGVIVTIIIASFFFKRSIAKNYKTSISEIEEMEKRVKGNFDAIIKIEKNQTNLRNKLFVILKGGKK